MNPTIQPLESRRHFDVVQTLHFETGLYQATVLDAGVIEKWHDAVTPLAAVKIEFSASVHRFNDTTADFEVAAGTPIGFDFNYITTASVNAPGLGQIFTFTKNEQFHAGNAIKDGVAPGVDGLLVNIHEDYRENYGGPVTLNIADLSAWSGAGQLAIPVAADGHFNETIQGSANFQVNQSLETDFVMIDVKITEIGAVAPTVAAKLRGLHKASLHVVDVLA